MLLLMLMIDIRYTRPMLMYIFRSFSPSKVEKRRLKGGSVLYIPSPFPKLDHVHGWTDGFTTTTVATTTDGQRNACQICLLYFAGLLKVLYQLVPSRAREAEVIGWQANLRPAEEEAVQNLRATRTTTDSLVWLFRQQEIDDV